MGKLLAEIDGLSILWAQEIELKSSILSVEERKVDV
jgi:hypothetical protein